ncbi:MAG: OmpA family protein [Hyphomicrobiales bacterium]|nr:OmpA family protein [Hyphomicrobiales bacterium]
MKRWILNSTTAIAIALSPIVLASAISVYSQIPAFAQNVDPALKTNFKSAKQKFKAAKKALARARNKRKGVKSAQQNFNAAQAALADAANQLKQARVATKLNKEARRKANKQAKRKARKQKNQAETTEAVPANQPKAVVDTTEPKTVIKKDKKTKNKKTKKKRIANKKSSRRETAPIPSFEAPKAKKITGAAIRTQIRKAEETATAVVPDNVTENQRKKLRSAERKRRRKAKERRRELLGTAAAGALVGALLPELGGRVVEDQGDRLVVERDGKFYVRKDESALFRHGANNVEIVNLRGGRTLEKIYHRNGSRVETLRDAGGYVLRRVKIDRLGRKHVLFDSGSINTRRRADYDRELPPIKLHIPHDEYEVSGGRVGRRNLAKIFRAKPVEVVRQQYTLRDVRESRRLRAIVRSVDLDTISFDSDSAAIREFQVPYLADIAGSIIDIINADPGAVFLIEGHTDAVGSEIYNLTLSDRRAETVARILVEAYDVPPENLITQGYGEQYLKINTLADERRNRRVTVRNISPLL